MTISRSLSLSSLMALASPALAGETPAPASTPTAVTDTAAARPPGWLLVTPGYTHQFDADLDGSDASLSAERWRLVLGTRIPFSDALTLTLGAETEWSQYEFDGIGDDVFGLNRDTDDLFVGQFGAVGLYDLNDTWQLVLGGTVSWGGDLDASFSDGLGGSALLGVTYRFSPRFSVTPGVLALARLEDDALVIPVLGLDWEINDSWRLRSIGPGAELTWSAADDWGFFLRGLYRPRDFRLAADAAVPSGVLRERAFPVSVGVEWKPTSRVTATVFGGAIFGGNLRLTEEDGGEVYDDDYDVAPIVGGSLSVLF
jgi:hypothetical protein